MEDNINMEDERNRELIHMSVVLSHTGAISGIEGRREVDFGPCDWELRFEENRRELIIRCTNKTQSTRKGLISVLASYGSAENGENKVEGIEWVEVKTGIINYERSVRPGIDNWEFDASEEIYWHPNRVTRFEVVVFLILDDQELEDDRAWKLFDWPVYPFTTVILHFEEDRRTLFLNREQLSLNCTRMAEKLSQGDDDDDLWIVVGSRSTHVVTCLNILANPAFMNDDNILYAHEAASRLGFHEVFRRCTEYLEARQEVNPRFAAALRRYPLRSAAGDIQQ